RYLDLFRYSISGVQVRPNLGRPIVAPAKQATCVFAQEDAVDFLIMTQRNQRIGLRQVPDFDLPYCVVKISAPSDYLRFIFGEANASDLITVVMNRFNRSAGDLPQNGAPV